MITMLLAVGAAAFGFFQAKRFVGRRLRYVDAVQTPLAPIAAGTVAALVALPVAAFLPFITGFTAILFGGGVGIGVLSGAKEIRYRRLSS